MSKIDIVNKELLVPGRVFPDEKLAPGKKGWTARTTSLKDAKNVYVKFIDDNQLYFFPVSEVKKWVVGDWEGAVTPSPKKQPRSVSPSKAKAARSSGGGKKKTMKELTKRAAPSRGGKFPSDEEINAHTEGEEDEEGIVTATARPTSPVTVSQRVKAAGRRSSLTRTTTAGGAAAKKAAPGGGGGRMGTLVRDIMYFLLGMVSMYLVLLYAFSQP